MEQWFSRVAGKISALAGGSKAFTTACAAVVVWGLTGPWFHYSDTWQLVINTATTIVTFLMVFLIQNTQNRDSAAIHVKLNAIVAAMTGVDNKLIGSEHLTPEQLAKLKHLQERNAKK
jgi:low affinity Fe/Cu permease